jgi:hypothetical protein
MTLLNVLSLKMFLAFLFLNTQNVVLENGKNGHLVLSRGDCFLVICVLE